MMGQKDFTPKLFHALSLSKLVPDFASDFIGRGIGVSFYLVDSSFTRSGKHPPFMDSNSTINNIVRVLRLVTGGCYDV